MPSRVPPLGNNQFKGQWIAVDLHVHSIYSGGSLTPAEILQFAQYQLLDAVGISDHFEVKGAVEGECISAGNRSLPQIIVSQEISLGDHFHLLVIGSKDIWPARARNKIVDKIYEHHRNGGAVILAHPWTIPQNKWASSVLQDLATANLLDGAELFNSSILEITGGAQMIQKCWDEVFLPYNLGVLGGSDFHDLQQGRFIGNGRTYLKVFAPGAQGIIEALRARRCVGGLYSFKSFDFGPFGKGNRLIFGMEPWYGELKGLQDHIKKQVEENKRCNLIEQKFIPNLIESGHFQHVYGLLYDNYLV